MTKLDIKYYSMKSLPQPDVLYTTVTALWNYATILNSGMKEFWSHEIPISGAAVYALSEWGLVEKTGETKDVFIQTYENNYKKYTAYKWRLRELTIQNYRMLQEDISSLATLVRFYENADIPLKNEI